MFSVLAWITPWTVDSDEEPGGGGLSVAHLLQQVSDNLLPHCAARYGSHVNPCTSFIQLKCCLRLSFGIRGHANWAVAVFCLVLSNDYCGFSISVSSPLSQPSRGTVLENQKQPKSLKDSCITEVISSHSCPVASLYCSVCFSACDQVNNNERGKCCELLSPFLLNQLVGIPGPVEVIVNLHLISLPGNN